MCAACSELSKLVSKQASAKQAPRLLDPCQYSVTDQFKSAHDPTKGFVLPGVFFIYDISPIKVKFTEKQSSFTCAMASIAFVKYRHGIVRREEDHLHLRRRLALGAPTHAARLAARHTALDAPRPHSTLAAAGTS